MDDTLSGQIKSTQEGMRIWHQERVIFETTERLCELLASQGVSRKKLADRLAKTKSHVTQLLDGETNMTLKTLSDTFLVLGREVHISDKPIEVEDEARLRYMIPSQVIESAAPVWDVQVTGAVASTEMAFTE